jgi:TolB protein
MEAITMRRSLLGWVAVIVAAVGFATATAPAWATFPGSNGRIAFVSDAAGDFDIWSVAPDGSGAANITDAAGAPGFDFEPAWSPDGDKLAFRSGPENAAEIYTVNADGTALTRLTANAFKDYSPAWSPDGSRIAFASNRNDPGFATCFGVLAACNYDIFVMPASGGSPVQITFDGAADQFPQFSPDGRFIAFVSDRSGAEAVYKVDLETLAMTKLTPDSLRAGWPVWSPDGTRIAFSSNFDPCHTGRSDCRGDIYVMNADGSGLSRLTRNFRENGFKGLTWSPAGDKIAFTHADNTPSVSPGRIYVMNADGTDVTRLTAPRDDSFFPDWGTG